MSRARNIKPGVMENERLAECSPYARLLFVYMWMIADRAGRMEDRPKRIKALTLPYDNVDAEPLLKELHDAKFINRYEVDGERYIQIVNFEKHQTPHVKEKASTIPACVANQATAVQEPDLNHASTGQAPDLHQTSTVQAPDNTDTSTELAPPDSLILRFSDSLIPDKNTAAEPATDYLPPPADEPSETSYAFEGETFRINQRDFKQHSEIYPQLDLLAEYKQLDVELRGKKKFWSELNAKLNYRNRLAISRQQGVSEPIDCNGSFIDDELRKQAERIRQRVGR